jgi:hypothetical protein
VVAQKFLGPPFSSLSKARRRVEEPNLGDENMATPQLIIANALVLKLNLGNKRGRRVEVAVDPEECNGLVCTGDIRSRGVKCQVERPR